MAETPLDVVIVGGSLSGLMHGIVLRYLGHNVRILERNSVSTQQSLGAGIAAFEDVHKLIDKYDITKIPYTVQSKGVQFLAADNNIKNTWNVQLKMTSWNLLYYMMRANYDGLVSALCPTFPSTRTPLGKAVYDNGKTVTDVEKVNGKVTVLFQDTKTGLEEHAEADLVIAADGTTSKLRQLLQPNLQRKYAGYVAWRGTAPEKEISKATRDTFDCKTTFFVMKKSYIVLYTIPGDDGNVAPGHRQLNWVWYMNCAEDSQDYIDVMTDMDGNRHRITLPSGKVDPKKWEKLKGHASEVLPPPFAEMVQKTANPFISSINDFDISKPSLLDGKLLFVGDALATFRPHVASSTHQASIDAALFERLVKGEITTQEWEDKVLAFARLTTAKSNLWGAYYMSGIPTLTFASALLRLAKILAAQWFQKRWYGDV